MKEKECINVLDELNKGACMGIDSINFIFDKIGNKDLKKVLNEQVDYYKSITDKIGNLYPDYSSKDPHETNAMDKAMTWWGIEMQTLVDKSDEKIAELLLKGTNMGIIEGRKLLNHKDTDLEVEDLIEEYIEVQEEIVEKLKKFL
ncbi:MAG: hypothetical protein OSJ70_03355 [Bacilli bacterium]|nr:hypothetical protein [Bacilli bacterium]